MATQALVLRGLFVEANDLLRATCADSLSAPLLFLGLTLSRRCNYQCRYCAQDGGLIASSELDAATLCSLVNQAKVLGTKSVILGGAGEPLLDPAFCKVVETAAACGLTTVLYTNGSAITPKMAEYLYEHDVSICIKFDTLDEARFNWLANSRNGFQQTRQGLENLLAVGYGMIDWLADGTRVTRLAINAVVTRVNLADLTELALYCERLSAKLFLDNLSLAGRAALNWKELLVSPADYTRACTAINSAMGYEDTGHSLNGGDACILWKYGIVVYLDGEVRVCYDDPAVPRIGSIFEQPLAELLQTKQTLYPAKPSEADCAIKCCLRQRFWEKVSHTLSPSEAVIYFGDSQGAAES